MKDSKPNIIFMGTPQIAADVLNEITQDISISAVITRPAKPKGRSKKPERTPVEETAAGRNIPVYTPSSKEELTKVVKKLKPDLGIIAAYGMIIPIEAIDATRCGIINFHPSLLPLYRGPDPISAPILNGDAKTGVSIIEISEKMDEGDILGQKEIPLSKDETAEKLEKKLALIGAEMLLDIVPEYLSDKAVKKVQNHDKATYTKMIKKEDGRINFGAETAEEIERKSRALTPWPGIYAFWDGKKINLYELKVAKEDVRPGKITVKNNEVLVGTKEGAIIPAYIQLEGKNKTAISDFLRGYPDFRNAVLE